MIAKCISQLLTEEIRTRIGASEHLRTVYQLTVGQTYVVLGITLLVRSAILGSTPVLTVEDDFGRCAEAPACLFEIIEGRPSVYWRARQFETLTLTLWPEEFYAEYFHDRLSDYAPGAVEVFKRVVDQLTIEASSSDVVAINR